MIYSCLVMIIFWYISESQQELFCHSGRAVFACSANLTSLTWEIRAASNIRRFLRLTNRDAIGYQLTATVAYTSVTAEIIESLPEFKISSLLSIQIPIFPELISVQCNGNRVYMDRNRISLRPLEKIIFIPINHTNGAHKFIVKLDDKENSIYKWISVNPIPYLEDYPKITTNNTINLRLKNQTIYNISITTCPSSMVTSLFQIGYCPFMKLPDLNESYIVWSNGSLLMNLRCADGTMIFIECGVNGEWMSSIYVACDQHLTITNDRNSFDLTETYNNMTVSTDMLQESTTTLVPPAITERLGISTQIDAFTATHMEGNSYILIPGISIGGLICSIITGIISFIFGVLYARIKGFPRPRTLIDNNIYRNGFSNDVHSPVYEEIQLKEKQVCCDDNIAYGNAELMS